MTGAVVARIDVVGYQRTGNLHILQKDSTAVLADAGRAFFTCTIETFKHAIVLATCRQLSVNGSTLWTDVRRLFQTDRSG
jgi:hypothetical protein